MAKAIYPKSWNKVIIMAGNNLEKTANNWTQVGIIPSQ